MDDTAVPTPDGSNLDLSTRARIRDAAILEFAAHGVKGSSIRGIAKAAGVSPGLVQHHFKSKQSLRAACDDHVLALMTRIRDTGILGGGMSDPEFIAEALGAFEPIMRYMARALADGGPAAASMFDAVFVFTETYLKRGDLGVPPPDDADIAALAAIQTTTQLGLLMLQRHAYRVLGAEPGDSATTARLGLARLSLASDLVLDPETSARIRSGLRQFLDLHTPPVADSDS